MSDARITLSAVDKTTGAFSSVKQRMAGLAGEAEGLSSRFVALGAAVGGAFLAKGFFDSIVAGIDRLNDLKDATGASIGNLSALEDIAARAGTEFEVVSTSLTKLNQALLAAKPGDGISSTLEAIGLQAQELRRLDPAQALLEVAQGLEKFADDGDKARATQVLFGRSLREVAPLLKDLAEAGQLNATVLEEQTAAAEKYAKTVAASQKAFQDLGRNVVSAVLPAINALADSLGQGAQEAGKFSIAGTAFKTVLETLLITGASVSFVFKGVGREIGAITAQLAALGRRDLDGFKAISEAVKADGELARKELEAFERRVLNIAPAGRPANEGGGALASNLPRPGIGGAGTGAGGRSALATQISEFDKYAQALARTLVSEKELGQEQQTRLDIAVGKLGKLNQGQAEYLIGLARAIDLQNKGDPLGAFVTDQLQRQNDRDRASVQALVDSSTGARFDALVGLTQRTTAAYAAGAISLQDYARAAESLSTAFDALQPQVEKVTATVNTFAEQAGRNIQDTLGDSLVRALDGDFKSIEKLWAETLKKMLAQAVASQLNNALFGSTFGQQGGKLGGLVGSLLTGGLFGGARANGGPVQAGRAYLVGERGPEMIVPANSGTVIPNGALGGGTVNINQTINVGQGVSRGEVAAATLQAKDAAVAEIRALMFRTGRGAI
jgi:hypothetical protein